MAEQLDIVKTLAANMLAWAANADKQGDAANAAHAQRWRNQQAALLGVIDELEQLQRATKPIPASYGDLSDIPPELLSELTGVKVDALEQQIHTIVKAGDGEVDLDVLLIELFRRFKVIQQRRFVQNKAWRMVQKGLIYSVAGKKGVYSARVPDTETTPQKVSISFGDLDDDVPF